MIDKLVLIPGISGKMGSEFRNRFIDLGGYDVIGISRSTSIKDKVLKADLLDRNSISNAFNLIDIKKYNEIYLIHAIGPFLFEEHKEIKSFKLNDNNHIHKHTYDLNFHTFKNIFDELTSVCSVSTFISMIAFGSISDRYYIPWWYTYSKAKNNLKNYMRHQVTERVRGIFINVSSTEKDDERPYADKEYWMSCSEVSFRTLRAILDSNLNWQEIDIFKPHPDFNYSYFEDLELIKTKWMKDMYG